jgi:hypothetical protein
MKLKESIGEKLSQIKGNSVPEIIAALNKVGKEYNFHVTAGTKGKWTAIWPEGKLLAATLSEVILALGKVLQK